MIPGAGTDLTCINALPRTGEQGRKDQQEDGTMSYKTILACAETEEELGIVMPVAMKIAKDHGAHIVGLHVMRSPRVMVHTPYEIDILVEAEERVRKATLKRAEDLGKVFESHVDDEADAVGEWRAVQSPTTGVEDILIEHARRCDLVIMAQPDPATDRLDRIGTVGEAIMQSGRPVLVVPYAWNPRSFAQKIFAAWNGSREGTRAIHDALPFLRSAGEVRLCAVGKGSDGEALQGAELAATLSRHGVKAVTETEVATGGMSVGATLLSRMADHGSDMLVMGGYGHSRAREYVFGGVTRDMLEVMTVPVLFSH